MKFNVAIIGAGNVAWHLAPALEDAGHTVTEVYARTLKSASKITERVYEAEPKEDLDFSVSKAELFIFRCNHFT
jgi:glutamyl-tRNA reductase